MVAVLYAKLYWALLASFCVMGLCLLFTQPVFSIPDEPAHWQTAHVRTERLLGEDSCVETVIQGNCPKKGPCSTIPQQRLACAEAHDLYGGISTYPGVLLSKLILPRQTQSATRQIQGIVLARLLQGLLVVVCLLRAGLVLLRAQRQGLLLLGAFVLSPLVAQQAFAISSDGVQIAFGVCLFTTIVAFAELGWIDLALFVIFGFCATAKPSLLPCILPAVLAGHWLAQVSPGGSHGLLDALRSLARDLRPTRRPSVQTLTLWAGIAITLLTVIFSLHHDATADAGVENTEARRQNASTLRGNPLLLLKFASSLRYDPLRAEYWVGPLGWLDVFLAKVIVNSFWRIVLVMLAIELGLCIYALRLRPVAPAVGFRYLGRALPALLLGLLAAVANVLFVIAIMYLLWTRPGASVVGGVQIRYFIPAVMVIIGVVFRVLGGLTDARSAVASEGAERAPHSPRVLWAAGLAAQGLVLSLSLPYVARVFVELSLHYHNPSHFN